jgi:NADH-quinone oxidoreductase subunit M
MFVPPHALSIIVLAPLVAAIIIMIVPRRSLLAIRLTAAVAASVDVTLAVWLIYVYLSQGLHHHEAYSFADHVPWVQFAGISYHLAANGISLALVLLTALVIFCGVFASWTITDRTKEFYALLLLLVTGVFGVFVAQDLFFFFLFYELAVLPMYLLIGIWGTGPKEYSAMKLTLYLLVGSAFMLVGMLGLYFTAQLPSGAPGHTFNLIVLERATYPLIFQKVCFFLLYIGFGILAGIWPLHTWSPDGHASAPTAVSMLHAGVLMKLGAYGLLRVGYACLPDGGHFWAWLVGGIAVINIVYGAYVAMGQRDLKYVIAYSSVSHMGVVMLGLAAFNEVAVNGAVLQMVAHGIMTGLFFALVGLVYEKAHTRDITLMGGFATRMPGIAVAFTIGGLSSFGLPGTAGFVAEALVFLGAFRAHAGAWLLHNGVPLFRILAIASVLAIVITATYVLRLVQRIFHGHYDEERFGPLSDARTTEWVALVILGTSLIALGVYPTWLTGLINTSLAPIITHSAAPLVGMAGALR